MTNFVQLSSGVVVSETDFAEMNATRPEFREVATTRDGRDITRGYVDAMPLLEPTDSVLQVRGGGDYTLYEEIKRDDQVIAALNQRRLAVVSKEWEVIPGGDKRRDKAAAESLKDQLDGVDAGSTLYPHATAPLLGFDAATDKMLWGEFWGYAVAECLWGRDGREVTLNGLRVRRQRRFAWSPEGALKLLTMAEPYGEELPPRKFWVYSVGSDNDDDPYGLGLAHYLYWLVFFKRNITKFALIYLDKFGQPTAKGVFPTNASPAEKSRLLAALRAIQSDSAIIVPQGFEAELVEAARTGTAAYGDMYDRFDRAIAKVILGHSGALDATPGKLGNDETADNVRHDIVKASADLVCESFNRTVARWLTDWNYPGAAYPRVFRKVEQSEDLNQVAEREKTIVDMGFCRPTLQHVHDTYGGEWEPVQPSTPPGQGSQQQPAEFAEAARSTADQLADRLEAEAAPAVDAMLERIRTEWEAATGWEDLQERLLRLYGDLAPDELARVMQLGFAVADLAGRAEVADGD